MDNGDILTARLFETIIEEEQAHLNYFDNISGHIETLGDAFLSKIAGIALIHRSRLQGLRVEQRARTPGSHGLSFPGAECPPGPSRRPPFAVRKAFAGHFPIAAP